jgi:hypothetical protein
MSRAHPSSPTLAAINLKQLVAHAPLRYVFTNTYRSPGKDYTLHKSSFRLSGVYKHEL